MEIPFVCRVFHYCYKLFVKAYKASWAESVNRLDNLDGDYFGANYTGNSKKNGFGMADIGAK